MASETVCPDCGARLGQEDRCQKCLFRLALAEGPRSIQPTLEGTGAATLTRPIGERCGSRLPEQIGSYRIVDELGSGGMGTVYQAYDEKMRRSVALKVLARHLAPSTHADQRFGREAWIAGRLSHPNLVKVYDRGQWEELNYFSMELVDGGSLHDVITRMRKHRRDEQLGLEFGSRDYTRWAITQVAAAARALHYAHENGVVHRDVKPLNLLLGGEPRQLKVADFGLAVDVDATRMTTDGRVMGTLHYMSPEQLRGEPGLVDARSDIYALGVTLFELLTLELPYAGTTLESYMNSVLTSEARRASSINRRVDRDLETVIRTAMAREPAERYTTAAAFADDLERVLHHRPTRARPAGWFTRTRKWVRRRPIHAALLATLFVAVPTITVLTYRAREQRSLIRETRKSALLVEARTLEAQGRYDALSETADELLALDPELIDGLRYRAMALCGFALETEGVDKALHTVETLETVERMIELKPREPLVYAVKAAVLHRLDLKEEAALARARAAELRNGAEPGDEELRVAAAQAHLDEDHSRAEQLYVRLEARHPQDAEVIGALGVTIEAQGKERWEEAENKYRLALGLRPDMANTHVDLGRLLTYRGKLEEGRWHLERAAELAPGSGVVLDNVSLLWLQSGMAAEYEGDATAALHGYEQAEKAALQAIAFDPEGKLLWARSNLALSLVGRSRLEPEPDFAKLERAMTIYRELLDQTGEAPRTPKHQEIHEAALQNLCDVQIEVGLLDEALESCSEIAELDPNRADNHYNLAGVFALLGRPEEALAELERDLEQGDTDWEYLANDSWFESLRGHAAFQALAQRMREKAEGQ